jgi:type III secretion system FlhB-like substrate exporter
MAILWILASMAALPYALYSEVVPIFTYRLERKKKTKMTFGWG